MTPNPPATDRHREAARELAIRVDEVSKSLHGPRFLFHEFIDELANDLAKHFPVSEKPGWISVSERLPDEDHPVWFFNGMTDVAVYRDKKWILLRGAEERCELPNVTYWREFPASPQPSGEEQR